MKRVISNIFVIVSIIIFIYVIYAVHQSEKNNEEVFIFGYKPYIIVSGSMEPELRVNGFVITKKGGYEQVKVGDIISFELTGVPKSICHRVIRIEDGLIVTKGDNNSKEDTFKVSEQNYIGKVIFKSNVTAYILQEVKTTKGIIKMVVCIISFIAIIITIKYLLKGKKRNEKINNVANANSINEPKHSIRK